MRLLTRIRTLDSRSPKDRIVAVGLLTQSELALLGPTFTRVWPVEEAPMFNQLLRAIDEADRELQRARMSGPAG